MLEEVVIGFGKWYIVETLFDFPLFYWDKMAMTALIYACKG
jgi:hypothetical protein